MQQRITVNGKAHVVEATADMSLLHVLRDELELDGPKYGCGKAQCGACMVHIAGQPTYSCVTPIAKVKGPITTLEGLGNKTDPHPLQLSFIAEQAAQCGYCTNGMIMRAAALLAVTPEPTDQEIRSALQGNLCRCGTHLRILRAVRAAAGVQA